MIQRTLTELLLAMRGLTKRRTTLGLFAAAYVLLLLVIGLFVTTREANVRQVLVTVLTLIAMPVLFFTLQAMSLTHDDSTSTREWLINAARKSWKLVAASFPILVIGLSLYLLIGSFEKRFDNLQIVDEQNTVQRDKLKFVGQVNERRDDQVDAAGSKASRVAFSTLRLLLFAFVLPLTAIHFWIAFLNDNAKDAWRKLVPAVTRAFNRRSIVTYAIGLCIFGLIPYLLVVIRVPLQHEWAVIALLAGRLSLAFILSLVGWVATISVLRNRASSGANAVGIGSASGIGSAGGSPAMSA